MVLALGLLGRVGPAVGAAVGRRSRGVGSLAVAGTGLWYGRPVGNWCVVFDRGVRRKMAGSSRGESDRVYWSAWFRVRASYVVSEGTVWVGAAQVGVGQVWAGVAQVRCGLSVCTVANVGVT